MNTSERKHFVAQEYKQLYCALPSVWSRAPGRLDLMGSHTDYNMGYVMTMTIDRDTWIAARPRDDRKVCILSANLEGGGEFDLDAVDPDAVWPWTNYVRGVADVLGKAGYPLVGFDGLVHSTIPFGAGLSSSAAIEMATAVLFARLGGFELEPVQMALLGQRAENQFVGVNSGILDQYSSALGQADSALLLDCRELTSRSVALPAGLHVVICDTRAKRSLAGSEYGVRRAQCEEGVRRLQAFYPQITALRDVSLEQLEAHEADLPEVVARRCRFIVEENARVLEYARALPAGDRTQLRQLMADSYTGARDLYEIGAPALEAMMAAMLSAPGVVAARQAGAGFGGCMMAFVEDGRVDEFVAHVAQHYAASTGIEPHLYPVQAAAGAGVS